VEVDVGSVEPEVLVALPHATAVVPSNAAASSASKGLMLPYGSS
jgi:hypothetical protein